MGKRLLRLTASILATALLAGCEASSKEDKARINRLDSLENAIDSDIESLIKETSELEEALNDLDTTTTSQ